MFSGRILSVIQLRTFDFFSLSR